MWLSKTLTFCANAEFAQRGQTVLLTAGNARPHIVEQWIGLGPSPKIVFPDTVTSRTSGKLPSKYESSGDTSRFAVPAKENVLLAMVPPLLLKRPRLYLVCANVLFRMTVPGVEKESMFTRDPRTTVAGNAELNCTRQMSEASNSVVE